MTLIDHYRQDVSGYSNTHLRKAARRDWLRAVVETLHERSLTAMPVPTRRGSGHPERFLPFWRRQADASLYEVYDLLLPIFRRPENRLTDL